MIHNSRGFTLIELMIAVSLLSLLVLTGTLMYRQLAERWDTQLDGFEETQELSRNFAVISQLLRGVQPHVVRDQGQAVEKPAFLFVGFEDSVLAISRNGLFNDDYPEIFRLSSRRNESGKFDLLYQSVSTQNLLVLTAQQAIDFEHEIVLVKDLDAVSFDYLGWAGYVERSNIAETLLAPSWSSNFSGVDRQLMPIEMRLFISQGGRQMRFTAPLDHSSLRWLTPYLDNQYGS
jgi:prepilin-type N-terminal cleavage/methylation domain-containing protein